MRNDENVKKAINTEKETERNSACCINNDGSGCVQSTLGKCPVSHNTNIVYGTFLFGKVCPMSQQVHCKNLICGLILIYLNTMQGIWYGLTHPLGQLSCLKERFKLPY